MGRSSGRKRAAVLGFLGLATTTTTAAETEDYDHAAGAAGWLQQAPAGRQYYDAEYTAVAGCGGAATVISKVRPSDEDGLVDGRPWWYAERDIDRRASEFIDRVHRAIDAPPLPSQSVQH